MHEEMDRTDEMVRIRFKLFRHRFNLRVTQSNEQKDRPQTISVRQRRIFNML